MHCNLKMVTFNIVHDLGITLHAPSAFNSQSKQCVIMFIKILLGRDSILQQVNHYITNDDTSPRILVLAGFPGAGKSALVAYLAKQAAANPNYKV